MKHACMICAPYVMCHMLKPNMSKYTSLKCYDLIQLNTGQQLHWISHRVCSTGFGHYGDVIVDAMASQITDVSMACSNIWSSEDQRIHQSPVSLAFMRDIPGPLNSHHKGSVTRKMFPFDDVIMVLMIW